MWEEAALAEDRVGQGVLAIGELLRLSMKAPRSVQHRSILFCLSERAGPERLALRSLNLLWGASVCMPWVGVGKNKASSGQCRERVKMAGQVLGLR